MKQTKPVFGNTYKDNSSIHKKYYDNLNKELEKYNVEVQSLSELFKDDTKKKSKKIGFNPNDDWNKNALDLEYDTEPSDDFKKRVRVNMLGFNSIQEYERIALKNGKEELPEEYQGNLRIYNSQLEKSKVRGEEITKRRHAGLKSREFPKKRFEPDYAYVTEGQDKVFKFKNKVFLTKETALENVPNEVRLNEGKHTVVDANGTRFIFESVKYDGFEYCKVDVVSQVNDNQVNETLNRMKELYGFKNESLGHGLAKGVEDRTLNEGITKIKEITDNL